jgi:hypothetical protein
VLSSLQSGYDRERTGQVSGFRVGWFFFLLFLFLFLLCFSLVFCFFVFCFFVFRFFVCFFVPSATRGELGNIPLPRTRILQAFSKAPAPQCAHLILSTFRPHSALPPPRAASRVDDPQSSAHPQAMRPTRMRQPSSWTAFGRASEPNASATVCAVATASVVGRRGRFDADSGQYARTYGPCSQPLLYRKRSLGSLRCSSAGCGCIHT